MSFNPVTQVFVEKAASPVKCWCGTEFIVGASLLSFWEDRGGKWAMHCPLGHTFIPGRTSEAAQLRDELTREKQRTEQMAESVRHYREDRDHQVRRLHAARGQVTRIKNRVKNGVCPACNRTFADVARHMTSKHPHYCEPEKA
jgi:hypothetical protein